ncbi:MAG: N-formylglutamate amidohydrolase [Micavibrio aeruginosavorus]|uniref:N-formylglutamate amidohydrolase n=1 Tax=Micavibrio aeruginosavorus TaxID=349221 RepID=A0A2W5PVD3_9BACT|nr:MAG: N-formylglutamate amidohydrolase [Micavibrio aeruginosavorus]
MSLYPDSFEIQNKDGNFPAVLCVEHARSYIPAHLNNLGVSENDVQTHIGWDIGIEGVSRYLSDDLNIRAIYGLYSRLVIDINRSLEHAELIRPESDGIKIPGNAGLGAAEREARIEQIFNPYHEAAKKLIRKDDVVIGMHSCTPQLRGGDFRPWHIGLSTYDSEDEMMALAEVLKESNLKVGIHEPYDCRAMPGTSLDTHGRQRGLPHILVEIRQDLIADEAGQKRWGNIMAKALIGLE